MKTSYGMVFHRGLGEYEKSYLLAFEQMPCSLSSSNLSVHKNHLGTLLKCRFWFKCQGWRLRLCISNTLLGTLRNKWLDDLVGIMCLEMITSSGTRGWLLCPSTSIQSQSLVVRIKGIGTYSGQGSGGRAAEWTDRGPVRTSPIHRPLPSPDFWGSQPAWVEARNSEKWTIYHPPFPPPWLVHLFLHSFTNSSNHVSTQ